MIYVSIDIETTGLSPENCSIIEFGAVIADSADPTGKTLGLFHRILRHQQTCWDDYARGINAAWYNEELMGGNAINPKELMKQFSYWLAANQLDPMKVVVAGKNFYSFDFKFISKLQNYGDRVQFGQRSLDPGILWFNPKTDTGLPNMDECCERAGIAQPKHRALGDCLTVIQLLHRRWYWYGPQAKA